MSLRPHPPALKVNRRRGRPQGASGEQRPPVPPPHRTKASEEGLGRLRSRLRRWYATHQRRLPWRETSDPYRIWVAEVMLQQTRVETVLRYYERFLERFPDLRHLAASPLQAVLKAWEGMGYYGRARNIHRAARLVEREHGGSIPSDYEAFRRLPGVGDYTAAAVLSIAFGQPSAVVDGNVRRVLARFFAVEERVGTAAARLRFAELADRFLDRRRPGSFNQALMELGATVCRPRRPDCPSCPLARSCAAFHTSRQAEFPRRSPRPPLPERQVAVGVVVRGGRLLITRRPAEGLLGGLWEFPGGRVEAGESPAEACRREIGEETGLHVEVSEPVAEVRHAYTHFRVTLHVFLCRLLGGRIRLRGPTACRWVRLADLGRYPLPAANHKFIPLLRERLAGRGRRGRAPGQPLS